MTHKPLKSGFLNPENIEDVLLKEKGCIVFLITSGYATLIINSRKRVLNNKKLGILFYDDLISVERTSSLFAGIYINLSYSEVEEAIYKLTSSNFWSIVLYYSILNTDKEQHTLIQNWFVQVFWICNHPNLKNSNELLKTSIYALFLSIDKELKEEDVPLECSGKSQSWKLGILFLKLINESRKDHREVQYYADQMHISTTYLNKITRNILNLSPKELINNGIIADVKYLLSNTNLSVKEIAAELNFEDSSYMCKMFKKQVGMSTTQYRNT